MTEMNWQSDARRAFEWISALYEQAESLFDDARAYLSDLGWSVLYGGGFGGIAMSMSDLREWPFAYFKVLGAVRQESETGPGHGLFFGVLFHSTHRSGPMFVVGRADWSDANAKCDHWVLLTAIGGDAPRWFEGAYEVGKGPIHLSRPTAKAAKSRSGVGDVRWFEVPLSSVSSADKLRSILDAAIALVDGDDKAALACVASES